jgi:hypothetical protein
MGLLQVLPTPQEGGGVELELLLTEDEEPEPAVQEAQSDTNSGQAEQLEAQGETMQQCSQWSVPIGPLHVLPTPQEGGGVELELELELELL